MLGFASGRRMAWGLIGPVLGLGLGGMAAADPFEGQTYRSCGIGPGQPVNCREEAQAFNVRDPEFLNSEFLTVWVEPLLDGAEGDGIAVVAPIDPRTGVIETDIASIVSVELPAAKLNGNGIEWGLSQRGPEAYFACLGPGGGTRICRISRSGQGDWGNAVVAGTGNTTIKDPSKAASTAVPRVHYLGLQEDGSLSVAGPYGVFADQPGGARGELEFGQVSGRWGPDGRLLFVSRYPAGLLAPPRIETFDVVTGESTPLLPDDGIGRSSPFPWAAPEAPGGGAFVARVEQENSPYLAIEAYRQNADGTYEFWNRIEPICAGYPFNSSPEPFVYKGRSFVSMVSYAGDDKDNDPGIIWVASVDPDGPQIRRLLEPATCFSDTDVRKDPEPVVLEGRGGVRVYFYRETRQR